MALRKSVLAPANHRVAKTATVPAPVGGLNLRDSLAEMQPTQAVIMVNFFPLQHGVRVRRGWKHWARGFDLPEHGYTGAYPNDGVVESLVKWNGPRSEEHLFAATNGSFFDISTEGAITGPVAINFLNNRWQYIQLANVQGNFTVAVNGQDPPVYYDGATWQM